MGVCFVEPKKAKDRRKEAYEKMGVDPAAKSDRKLVPNTPKKEPPPSHFKPLTEEQLVMAYSVEELLRGACFLEGPKLLCHRSTGALRVLRVIIKGPAVSEERVAKFKVLTGSEAYQIGDYYLLVSDFLSGPNILEYLAEHPGEDCSPVLRQVYAIIQAIHDQGLVHGSLSFDSFRARGGPSVEFALADMNFSEKPDQLFGSLQKSSPAADWEFFGMLVNIAVQGGVPYFSKESLQYKNQSPAADGFLQGKPTLAALGGPLATAPSLGRVLQAYQLRLALFHMLKLRQRHRRYETKYFYDKETNALLSPGRPLEEQRTRIEKNRVNGWLRDILARATPEAEQDFVWMGLGGPKLAEFAYVLRIQNAEKRMEEVGYKLSSIL